MPLYSFDQSRAYMRAAARYLPGGVSSNFRAGISPTPLLIRRAAGAHVTDADGNRLIDYYLGMGPMILGHSPRAVIEAVRHQLEEGILFAAQSEAEYLAARRFCELVPCAERVRFGSSGSEVVQAALRLARAATGRQIILKFEGHYHGWFDSMMWTLSPDSSRQRNPGTAGSDSRSGDNIEVMAWNDATALTSRLRAGDVAAVIMEPIMCNGGSIAPRPGYLAAAREACTRHGTILIFDEIITGFRVAPGGGQQLYDLLPDLATFGKAIANGFPVAALAGRAELLELFASGGVMHAGTYNSQAVAMAAAAATLDTLAHGDVYEELERRGGYLMKTLERIFAKHGIPACVQGRPAMFHVAFGISSPIESYRDLLASDRSRYIAFATALLERGVRIMERGTWFLSYAHDDQVIEETLQAVDSAAQLVASGKGLSPGD